MKFKSLFIIGLLLLLPHFTYAQSAGGQKVQSGVSTTDCDSTLYETTFICKSKGVSSYCAAQGSSTFNIYGQVYCNDNENLEDEIFKNVATQLGQQEPKYNNPDLVKHLLFDIQKKSITDFLLIKYGKANAIDELPDSVREAFFNSASYENQIKIQERIRRAYNNQKVVLQTKKSLKAQFEASEIWMDGNLGNAPFDLIVDLNIIERILFGSQAKWLSHNDVWKWPQNPIEEAKKNSSNPDANNPSGNSSGNPNANGNGPKNYECKPLDDSKKESLPIPKNCGDGVKQVTEQCDDGNNESGDGCSSRCVLESGTDLMCVDTQALSLKPYQAGANNNSNNGNSASGGNNQPPINCPPGTEAVEKNNNQVAQSPNYGGPLVGGVLKNFPVSNRPKCPAGMTEIEVEFFGQSESTCVPDQLCADPNIMRDFLYLIAKGVSNNPLPDTWQDLPEDDPLRENLDMIEVAACIKVTKNNRPLSPYPTVETCIDCHVQAMNDSMNKLLAKSVAPSQTAMQAFGLSNRWGPRYTLDINLMLRKLKNVIKPKLTTKDAQKNADQFLLQAQKKSQNLIGNTIAGPDDGQKILERVTTDNSQKQALLYDQLKAYQLASTASASQSTTAILNGSLTTFKGRFEDIQTIYDQLVTSVEFAQKRQCTF